jgi:hypothetical protein
MTVRVVLVEEEYFCALLVLYLPLLGITVNWYLIAQLPSTNLTFLLKLCQDIHSGHHCECL